MARAAGRLIVTTSTRATPALAERARVVAARCGAAAVPRRGPLEALLADANARVAYLVARERESLLGPGSRVTLDEGMLHAHRALGRAHPLIRALGPASRVVDATLGLCHDALHVAEVARAEVIGIEASPALYSLAEAGLARLAAGGLTAAARVRPRSGDAREVLRTLDADAVMLSPMFDEPRAAAPGFDVLREVAVGDPLDPSWLDAALACAPRVVLKARRGQPVPDFARPRLTEILRGKAVDYWVLGG